MDFKKDTTKMDFKTMFYEEYNKFKEEMKTNKIVVFNRGIDECANNMDSILKSIAGDVSKEYTFEVCVGENKYKYIQFYTMEENKKINYCEPFTVDQCTLISHSFNIDENKVKRCFLSFLFQKIIKPNYKG